MILSCILNLNCIELHKDTAQNPVPPLSPIDSEELGTWCAPPSRYGVAPSAAARSQEPWKRLASHPTPLRAWAARRGRRRLLQAFPPTRSAPAPRPGPLRPQGPALPRMHHRPPATDHRPPTTQQSTLRSTWTARHSPSCTCI